MSGQENRMADSIIHSHGDSGDRRSVTVNRGFDEQAAGLGRDLVIQLQILFRTAQIHDSGNVAVEAPLENCAGTLRQMARWQQETVLSLDGDHLFLNDTKLKMDIESFSSFAFMVDLYKRHQLGAIVFRAGLKPGDLLRFVYLVARSNSQGPEPFASLSAQHDASAIAEIGISELIERDEDLDEGLRDSKEMAKSVYFKTMTTVHEVMENIKLGQAVSVKRAKRVVQSMVDVLLQEESTILGLTTLRSHDEYTHNHSVNVCVLTLTLAQRLGYSKKQLTEVGMAGLFHDLGKAVIPLEILNKATDFTEEEWRVMRKHPVQGVRLLLKLKGVNPTTIRMIIGVFEHHLNLDNSGYPKLESLWRLSLLGRMISICDCYDALTSARVYNRVPYAPERALKFMLSKSGKAFDPVLMKIFVNGIGIFPIGTLVLLNSGELGVVMAVNPGPDKADRPKVKVIADASGNEIDGEIVDTSKMSGKTDSYIKSIVKTVDPFRYKIDVSRYFL